MSMRAQSVTLQQFPKRTEPHERCPICDYNPVAKQNCVTCRHNPTARPGVCFHPNREEMDFRINIGALENAIGDDRKHRGRRRNGGE